MSEAQTLLAEIEAVAAELGISPSTVGERAGQGGRFYSRLKAGKRVWPDTAAKVRERLASLRLHECDKSHGGDAPSRKGAA
jgi:hypothetical protein